MYTSDSSQTSTVSGQDQSFLARLDLNAKTASRVSIPYDVDLYFFQFQHMLVVGDDIIFPVAPVGKDGNIYIINKNTNAVTKGAVLKNLAGGQFIGAF